MSLGSSGSLSRSQQSLASSSPAKAVDLLAVLTHILGRAVPRGDGQGEFVCGKCACTLERVFRFDTVISRVKVLSAERLQKLTRDRDQMRQWVRQSCRRRDDRGASSGTEDGEAEREGEAYREMLRDNMALSEYECWSERWDTCPYFVRTGKRCRRGTGCEGCDSLRVPDSAYESVCGVPRRLPFRALSPLDRDKSRSMPLHWQGALSGPASLSGSSPSLRASSRASSRTASVRSLDSPDSDDTFELPSDRTLDFLLTELKGVEGAPLSSPSGSRIPVLGRWLGRAPRRGGVPATSSVSRTLSFGENGEDQGDGEDVLKDDFLSLHPETASGPLHRAVGTLRGQLDRALDRVRTLETQLDQGGRGNGCQVNGSKEATSQLEEEGGRDALLQILRSSLHSRELLIQECLVLIGTLSEERGSSPELSDTLSHSLEQLLSQNKEAVRTASGETTRERAELRAELEALRRAGRDRDGDLDTLNSVLRRNRDLIQDLREALQEKERLLEEVRQERELWSRRDGALAAVLQEKDEQVHVLRQQLEEGASGGGARWEQRLTDGATLCQEVSRLTDSLKEYQQLVQAQQQSHEASLSRLTNQLQEARKAQREELQRRREEQRRLEEQQEEQRRLQGALWSRDTLIQEILQDAERRDFLFTELQKKPEPLTAIKHTL